MADRSLAAERILNRNLLGSLSPVEIYEEQLRASDHPAVFAEVSFSLRP